jgi:hypothetical protein
MVEKESCSEIGKNAFNASSYQSLLAANVVSFKLGYFNHIT